MPYNGAGIFTLTTGNPVVTGTVISSTWANNTLSDIANNGLTNCITKDGQTTPTANIPMGGFRLTNLAAGVAATDSAQLGQVQGGTYAQLGSVSGTDTIVGTASPTVTAYVAGQMFRFVSAGANTTSAVTLNIGSLGAKPVTKVGSAQLNPGDIPAGSMIQVVYDGTQFQVTGGLKQSGSFPPRYRDLTRGTVTQSSTTAVTIAAGAWRGYNDDFDIVLPSAFGKSLQVAGGWVAGTGNAGIFSGVRTNNTMYHIFVIRKDSDGTIDAGFDTSITAANRPVGYTAFRRVGSMYFASGAWAPCKQAGDVFMYQPRISIASNVGITSGAWRDVVLSPYVPIGIPVRAHIEGFLAGTTAMSIAFEENYPSATPAAGSYDLSVAAASQNSTCDLDIVTRAADGFIAAYASVTIGSGFYVTLRGYQDFLQD